MSETTAQATWIRAHAPLSDADSSSNAKAPGVSAQAVPVEGPSGATVTESPRAPTTPSSGWFRWRTGPAPKSLPVRGDTVPVRRIVEGPTAPVRVVIGSRTPTPVIVGLRSVTGTDSTRLLPSKAACEAPRRARLSVVQTRIEPSGAVTCWVRLLIGAPPTQSVPLSVRLEFQKTATRTDVMIEPVAVPLFAVRSAEPACHEVARRVEAELAARGRPVVAWNEATRQLALEHCEQLARLLPVRNREVAPTGFYVRGMVSEAGQETGQDPQTIGPFEFTITKAGVDPMVEAVREAVDRLLKYRGL
ncbi:MAG: hypothetical protein H3C62_15245 [Gemmatimonadaceae bacterium]|nr:hypothetical protein [Gemmatimonadaceae bacterium]